MNRDLFLAILAMDSYNRGYDPHINGFQTADGVMLGNAIIKQDSGVLSINGIRRDEPAGFYAIAYEWNGEKIVSYRGTNPVLWAPVLDDAWHGFGVGTGSPYGTQAELAIEFYKSVVGTNGNPFAANVSLTGHSLGGGLAGLVAALYGREGTIFDNMAFETAANNAQLAALQAESGIISNTYVRDLIYGTNSIISPNNSNISAFATTGEFLAFNRIGQNTPVNYLDSNGGYRDPIFLHSMALQVALQWAQLQPQLTNWHSAGDVLWDAFQLSDAIAATLTLPASFSVNNGASRSTFLQEAIAYSAISEGARPFGDTGIISMFDDAEDLGKALKLANSSQSLRDAAGAIGQVIVEYAGKLALGQVLGGSSSAYANGIVQLAADQQSLAVDFSGSRWAVGSAHDSIVGRDALMKQVLSTLSANNASDLVSGMSWAWATMDTGYIQRAVFQTTNAPLTTTLPDSGNFPGTNASIFVAGDGDDVIHGSLEGDAEVIVGGVGNDTLFGEDGNDILVGGSGNDILVGGAGQDFLAGGAGYDRIDLGLQSASSGVSVVMAAVDAQASDQRSAFQIEYNGDTDRAIDIEQLDLTSHSDTVRINYLGSADGDSPLADLKIDFKGADAPTRTDDMLDFSGAGIANATTLLATGIGSADAGVYVDLSDKDNQVVKYYYDWGSLPIIGDVHTTGSAVRLQAANANSVKGTVFDDVLIAQAGTADHGEGYATLYGGAGNDQLTGGGWESHLYGGTGSDSFSVGSNVTVEDGELRAGDATYFAGFRLNGGVKAWWMEGNTAYWMPFTSLLGAFPVIGAELLSTAAIFVDVPMMKFASYQLGADGALSISLAWGLGGTAQVKNYSIDSNSGSGTAGITVFQQGGGVGKSLTGNRIESYVSLALYAGFGHGMPGYDPLVLDLDGDGFNLVAEDVSSTYFEFDNDGFGEHVGWVRGTDGFLVRDANANGKIDNVSEMFGNQTTGGFDVLAGYDYDLNGSIDASDTVFASLSVWQDHNQDGITDAGELKTLAQLGIVSIGLAHAAPASPTVIGGNVIAQIGNFTRADGSTGGIADVVLGLNETNTQWLGDKTISVEAEALPQLSGFGEIKDLRVAMSGDSVLIGLVADYVEMAATSLDTLESGAEAILYRWAGVDAVIEQSLGSNGFDTRKLAFLEKYTGYEMMPRSASGVVLLDNLDEVEALWVDQLTRLTLRLAVQGPLGSDFDGITYDAERDLLVASTPTALGDLLHNLLSHLPNDPVAAAAQWANWGPLLGALTESMVRFDANIVRADYVFAQLVAAMDDVVQPLSLQQLSSALGIANVQIGSAGNDSLTRAVGGTAIFYAGGGNDQLNGGGGQDVYVFGREVGHAIITDIEARESGDRIRFAFLNRSDVSLERNGADLVITITATSETVRVVGQFADVTPGGADLILSSNKGVEDIQFADGTVMEIPAIMIAVGAGTDGDDHLIGTMHSDALTGGKGNDLLQGGDDADLYVVNAGDGHDIIEENQSTPLLRSADMVVFGDDVSPDDLVISRVGTSGADLLFTIGTSGQSLLIRNQFGYSSLGYNAALGLNSRIEAFSFREYGDAWSYKDVQQKLIAQATTAGADVTRGFGDDDTFQSSAANDILIGMDGADTYNWGKGSGHDTIDEQAAFIDVEVGLGGISLTTRADTVQFSQGVTLADLKFSRDSSAPDLTITILSTGEKLTVKKQFDGIQTGVLGAQWFNRVEWFQLADGTRISWQDVEALVTTGGVGDDQLYGDIVIDTMKGGVGNDFLSGGGAGDTYIFNSGDGHDTLQDNNWSFLGEGFVTVDGSPDILQFGSGITAADISFARNGKDVDLIIGTTGDRVTLKGQDDYIYTGIFGNLSANRIEEIRFADGTVWTWQQINRNMIAAATTTGDDITLGTSTEDVFASSAGNDIIDGGDGSDIYAFDRGTGHDIIRDHVDHIFNGEDDRLNFGAGITLADLAFSRESDDLIITIIDTGDTVRIEEQFRWDAWYVWHDIETFGFTDGSTITNAAVQQILLTGTVGNDTLVGFSGDDLLDGGAGDDQLIGGDGSDTYVFGRGYGNDTIQEQVGYILRGDDDKLSFTAGITEQDLTFVRDGDDLVITIIDTTESIRIYGQFASAAGYLWQDIETFAFADGSSLSDADVRAKIVVGGSGNDTLVGFVGSDTLDGKAGDDLLYGGDGNDVYIFGRGYGNDVIYEQSDYIFNGDYDQITFLPGVTLADLGFARDGSDLIITILDTGDSIRIDRQWEWQSDFYTWRDIEIFNFADGSSVTKAQVQQIMLTGGSGNDTLTGFTTDDTLTGSAGNDLLMGAMGADRYIYNVGDGNDVISEYVWFSGSYGDRIVLGAGITPAMLQLAASASDPSDMVITFDGIPGSITIENQILGGQEWGIDFVEFADGTIWDASQLHTTFLATKSTSGNDTILGSWIAETLVGGAGDDTLQGGGSDDVYLFNIGDGHDIISESPNGGNGFDTIKFGSGIAADGLSLALANSGADIVVTFTGTSDQIIIANGVLEPNARVEKFLFADGTQWDFNAILAAASGGTAGDDTIYGSEAANYLVGAGGNDLISGRNGNDTLIGGTGNDTLYGGGGDDDYAFNRGDGQDLVSDYTGDWRGDGYGGNDEVVFGADIAPSDVIVSQGNNGNDLVLSISGTTDQVTLSNTVNSGDHRIEQVRFADGTVWSHDQLMQRSMLTNDGNNNFWGGYEPETLNGGTGNDMLNGRGGNDVLIGSMGNDTLYGAGGDDDYVISRGDGQDVVSDYTGDWRADGYGGNDEVLFGADIAPSDIIVSQGNNGNDLILSISGTTDQVTLSNTVNSGDHRIEQVRFADGTVWTHDQLMQRSMLTNDGNNNFWGGYEPETLNGGTGNDMLNGRGGNDVLIGSMGNDTLYGAGGDDDYVISRGDGQDVISDYTGDWRADGYGGNDEVLFGADIAPSDIIVSQGNNGNDLVLSISGTTDQITLSNTVNSGDHRIEQVRFADGTVWTHDQLMQRSMLTNDGNNNFWGGYEPETLNGGTGNDMLNGRGGNDVLIGSMGNDTLYGAGGDDDYVISRGDGQDVISDYTGDWRADGYGGNDEVLFGADIAPSDIIVSQGNNGNDLVLSISGTTDQITLSNTVNSGDHRIEQVRFADGTVWTHDQLLGLSLVMPQSIAANSVITFVVTEQTATTGATNSDSRLRAFDINRDSMFSGHDEKSEQFEKWQDKNSNGTADENDVFSLATDRASGINLVNNAVRQNRDWGQNMAVNTGTSTLNDGSTSSFSDAALSYDTTPRGILPFGQRISSPGDRYAPLMPLKEAARLMQAMAAFGIEDRPDEMSVRDEWGDRSENIIAACRMAIR